MRSRPAPKTISARTLSSVTTLIIETNPNQAPTATPSLPANGEVLNRHLGKLAGQPRGS